MSIVALVAYMCPFSNDKLMHSSSLFLGCLCTSVRQRLVREETDIVAKSKSPTTSSLQYTADVRYIIIRDSLNYHWITIDFSHLNQTYSLLSSWVDATLCKRFQLFFDDENKKALTLHVLNDHENLRKLKR